jgi:hypothetical protein
MDRKEEKNTRTGTRERRTRGTCRNANTLFYAGPDVELVVSPVNNAVAPASQLTCLQLPTPDGLTRSGDPGGHIHRGISRILLDRAYLDLLAFCEPSPPDYMSVISGTSRGALYFFALHESSFKVPSDCYTMPAHRVLGLTAEPPFMFGSALGAMKSPQNLVGLDRRRRYRAPLCR